MSRRRRKKQYTDIVNQLKNADLDNRETMQYAKGTLKKQEVQIPLRDYSIVWGFPMDELMFSKFFENLPNLNVMPWDAIITTMSTYLPDARNAIHEQFVKSSKKYQFLAMLDSDVLAPPWYIDTLIKHNKPLVGGWYKHKVPSDTGFNPVVYDYKTSEHDENLGWDVNYYQRRKYPGEGLERVDALGAGCLLMRRDLAEALGERPYDMNAGGEDMVLCKKVYDLGFDIHVDWSLACAHVGVSYV